MSDGRGLRSGKGMGVSECHNCQSRVMNAIDVYLPAGGILLNNGRRLDGWITLCSLLCLAAWAERVASVGRRA